MRRIARMASILKIAAFCEHECSNLLFEIISLTTRPGSRATPFERSRAPARNARSRGDGDRRCARAEYHAADRELSQRAAKSAGFSDARNIAPIYAFWTCNL